MEPHLENLQKREKEENELPSILQNHYLTLVPGFLSFFLLIQKIIFKTEIIFIFISVILKYTTHLNIDLIYNVIKLEDIIMEH